MWQKDRFPTHFAFYTLFFTAIHVHVELCDWLDFVEVTSSGHFSYLSAGRSQLTTFTWDQAIEEVSISSPLSHLVRRAVQPAAF